MKKAVTWSCVLQYALVISVLCGVMYYCLCGRKKPARSIALLQKKQEDYESPTSPESPKQKRNCWEIAKICRIQHGDQGEMYCQCMKALGCDQDWCKCFAKVNECAAKSRTRKEFCKCIGDSECAKSVMCNQDTNLDCGTIATRCKKYYPDEERACAMYWGCKPDSDPICEDCNKRFAGDAFYASACKLCRGCVANEAIYGDRKAQKKMPKCSEIPAYVEPRKKLTPKEQEMADYLRINKQCGFTNVFNFPGDSFSDELEKRCYCCTGMTKNNNQYDSCNCAGVDCVDEDSTKRLCKPFMNKYDISWSDVPAANVSLGDKEKKAIKTK